MPALPPFSCDTSVALPPLTAGNQIIFAKNSDRAVNECQPLHHIPRQSHSAASTLRTQYLEIPQVDTTWEMIGSAPYWLWGFEMGVNEWGVTIGNEAVHTREANHDRALIGMDLVRLGLERARTAEEAVDIIGALIEHYGQGGSCEATHYRTYQNSFIIADATAAWILETAGHRWVATTGRRARRHLQPAHPLRLGPLLPRHRASTPKPRAGGDPEGGFAAAYQDPETDLTTRIAASTALVEILGGYQPGIGVPDMMAVLRDHGGRDLPTGPEPLPTICVHANPAFEGETAAVHGRQHPPEPTPAPDHHHLDRLRLPLPQRLPPRLPTTLVGLPESVSTGGATYDPASPWWIFEHLQRLVARAPGSAAFVRDRLRRHSSRPSSPKPPPPNPSAAEQLAAGNEPAAIATLRALVDSTTDRAITLARQLTIELPLQPDYSPLSELSDYWNARDALVMPADPEPARP